MSNDPNEARGRLRCTPVVNHSFEHQSGDNTIWLNSTPILKKTLWRWLGPPNSLPLPPTLREDLRFDGYVEYPHAAKTLHIYRHPCLLRDSNPGPMAQQSASLTTIRMDDFPSPKFYNMLTGELRAMADLMCISLTTQKVFRGTMARTHHTVATSLSP
ncbi:uncharacterized protein TNCV_4156311 [Trichonephila clavipes]|nr:uncharacterized protein TNCV_4156311 [Trichonephila clavipes]